MQKESGLNRKLKFLSGEIPGIPRNCRNILILFLFPMTQFTKLQKIVPTDVSVIYLFLIVINVEKT
jgi:hypothetical protein